jgi:DNA-directed RNA polymerase subunit M/transcription elongation factor TFIIS
MAHSPILNQRKKSSKDVKHIKNKEMSSMKLSTTKSKNDANAVVKNINNSSDILDEPIAIVDDEEFYDIYPNIEPIVEPEKFDFENAKLGMKLGEFDIDKLLPMKKYNFITEKSKDLEPAFITKAEKMLSRDKVVISFNKILNDIEIALKLEQGIFEYALVYVAINDIFTDFITPIYSDKANDITVNINGDPIINNTTLKDMLLVEKINPHYVAFMSPQQIHPLRWKTILDKKKLIEFKQANQRTTDLYKCGKCGERKMKISQFQTRGADEAAKIFITCVVCYNVFTK